MTSDGTNQGAGEPSPDAGSPVSEPGKPVSASQVVMARQMMPDDANPWGYIHGGVIMKMVDEAAGSAAIRHARCRVATVAIDYMSFLSPVHIGDLVTLKASVNDVGSSSMEVGVRVECENMMTGHVLHTSSAYVVMVALDEAGNPVRVPPLRADTADEKRRMAAARVRRAQRKVLEQKIKQSADDLVRPAPVSSGMVSVAAGAE
ncbi:MAG TPA: acyl-CoA thioesterase [Chloroflexota bacterium]|nr:acyl-CoA thioesterase [Chloroflexota bacterium]